MAESGQKLPAGGRFLRCWGAGIAAAVMLCGCEKKAAIVLPPITVSVTAAKQQDVPIYGEWIGTLTG